MLSKSSLGLYLFHMMATNLDGNEKHNSSEIEHKDMG